MLHLDPHQLPKVEHLHNELVRLPSLEEVAELLLQVTLARVPINSEDSDEHICVRSGPFDVPGDDDDFVLDRDQFANFARKALNGFITLKCLELVLFGWQRDLCITVKEKPKPKDSESKWFFLHNQILCKLCENPLTCFPAPFLSLPPPEHARRLLSSSSFHPLLCGRGRFQRFPPSFWTRTQTCQWHRCESTQKSNIIREAFAK